MFVLSRNYRVFIIYIKSMGNLYKTYLPIYAFDERY